MEEEIHRAVRNIPHSPDFFIMDLVIVSDIFGHTPALDRLASRLRADHIHILAPHDRVFTDEAEAYAFFQQTTDISGYAGKISEFLWSMEARHLALVGFSVGAAAIWQIAADPKSSWIQKAFCFYGSRIREQTGLCPVFPVDLIFPAQEPHFDVSTLARELSGIPDVSCIREKSGSHGFMNEHSMNFSPVLYRTWTDRLNQQLSHLGQMKF